MWEIFIKGLFIGFLSSAPMGPVGMLCIQRTLNDSKAQGLITGSGAAIGDMLIALVAITAILGIGFSTEFINKYESILQIIGSLILIVFGIFIFRKNPSRNLKKLDECSIPFWRTFLSAFILTVSNIGTLFLYIALFARFSIIEPSQPILFGFITILIVGIGAMLWWLLVTYFVNKLRTRFNPRGLQIFNRIVGSVLFIVGLVGISTAITSL